ncbi:type 1 glutamine amidotransferase domain-containing protein [Parendozoicomonas haliclonae]|uniref:Putative cysteine protease YraA n=1 Tax=Parendozoicomonas haliclonae TaxID=1960125 RepID=A0A1X7AQJ3_9GAMM|nr:type 1 glutamine amidotransferase domain-containing protein [Parendozoicomonas haliclonae]SMA50360.1 putative cysteine protease YraA [Parendozoicomonas haliclonae]
MKVLFVLTSHDQLGDTGEKTGFWTEEFAGPYYTLLDAGAEITLASPAGGQPPVDPKSGLPDFQTDATRRLDNDPATIDKLATTHKLVNVSADDFDAVFYPGGHGPLWDLTTNGISVALIEAFIKQGKPVSAVCHASCVLLNAFDPESEPLLKGKNVTGFSNTEEDAVQLTNVVPFLLEDELVAKGGHYTKGADWSSHVVTDGLLITGQNPQSSVDVAKALLKALQAEA